jgi:SPP1 gp7 family putative phage head morphogenesis protein
MDEFSYDAELIAALVTAIYLGKVTLENLPLNLYIQTARVLNKAVSLGIGTNAPPDLVSHLRNNIYIFSAAKTATQVDDINSLMVKDGGALSLPEFKKAATARFQVYNQGWLESEYVTAQTAASSAVNWQYTEDNKHLFPRLKSYAIIDQYTAVECMRMNGVIASVDDPIWNHNIAPRHWRCRCHEERIDKYDSAHSTSAPKLRQIESQNDASMQDIFKFNPGKDKIVFSNKHPYYEIAKKHPDLAKNNFNLPIP